MVERGEGGKEVGAMGLKIGVVSHSWLSRVVQVVMRSKSLRTPRGDEPKGLAELVIRLFR